MQITKTNQTIWDTLQPSLLAFARPYRRALVLLVIFFLEIIIFSNGFDDSGLKISVQAIFTMFFCLFPFFVLFARGEEGGVGDLLQKLQTSFFCFMRNKPDQNPFEPKIILSHLQVVPLSPPRFRLA